MSKNSKDVPLDLEALKSLEGFSLGHAWGDSRESSDRNRSDKRPQGRGRPQKRHPGRHTKGRPERKPDFKPVVQVNFYPEEQSFDAFIKAVKNSFRTYALFEVAKLVLEKPERHVIALANLDENAKEPTFFTCTKDNAIFLNEADAWAYSLSLVESDYFETETFEREAPKGTFPIVKRCGVTGKLLGPPNHHSYQATLNAHFQESISNMSMDRFLSKLETVKDEEAVNAWVESMKAGTRFKLRVDAEDAEALTFESRKQAHQYLKENQAKDLVKASNKIRISGTQLESLSKGPLRHSIETVLAQQQRFPLDTSNSLRGRFRRLNFDIYKDKASGITYVCPVKRKLRTQDTPFAEKFSLLIQFIEKHPKIAVAELPERYLGIKAKEPKVSADASVAEKIAEDPTSVDQARIRELLLDLRWLVSEGYVVEYGDATLFAPAARKAEPAKQTEATLKGSQETPKGDNAEKKQDA